MQLENNRISYGIRDACEVTGLGRSFLYEQIAKGALTSFTIGRRRLIAAQALEAFISKHQSK